MKCPKCDKDIVELRCYEKLEKRRYYTLTNEGKPYYYGENWTDFEGELEFECPNCDSLLFTDEGDASDFLKGQ
jgi:phage FluMu protein Com